MPVTEVDETPSTLGLYARAAMSAVRPGGGGDGLPDEEVLLRDVEIDRDHLAAYDRVCGFDLSDELPATYLHVVAFPMALTIMTRRDFPFPLPGMVHVANRIVQHRPILSTERPTLKVSATGLRPHRKGQQLDLVATAEVGGTVVWEDVSTYLKRGGGSDDAADPGSSGEADLPDEPGPGDPPPRNDAAPRWQVPSDIGRRYGAVSGDRNPIHLHPLLARAFGFPRHIAHGMWTKARCLAAIDSRLPDAYEVDVRFERPVLLPTKVAFTAQAPDDGAGWRFALHATRGDDRHLTGEVTPA